MGLSWTSPWGGVVWVWCRLATAGSVAFNWVPSWSFLRLDHQSPQDPPPVHLLNGREVSRQRGRRDPLRPLACLRTKGPRAVASAGSTPATPMKKITGCRGQKLIEPMKPNFVIQIPRVRYVQRPQADG